MAGADARYLTVALALIVGSMVVVVPMLRADWAC